MKEGCHDGALGGRSDADEAREDESDEGSRIADHQDWEPGSLMAVN